MSILPMRIMKAVSKNASAHPAHLIQQAQEAEHVVHTISVKRRAENQRLLVLVCSSKVWSLVISSSLCPLNERSLEEVSVHIPFLISKTPGNPIPPPTLQLSNALFQQVLLWTEELSK